MAYEVPPLPYAYEALEPHIDEATMGFHHDKHHQAYVDKANAALEGTPLDGKPIEEVLADLEPGARGQAQRRAQQRRRPLQPHAVLGVDEPGRRRRARRRAGQRSTAAFGSFDDFKAKLKETGVNQFGSGWSWLVHDGSGLAVVGTPNQDTPLSDGQTPLLGVDVWEHAYYLKYQNKRPDYIDAWWNVVDWGKVAERYDAVAVTQSTTLGLPSGPRRAPLHRLPDSSRSPSRRGGRRRPPRVAGPGRAPAPPGRPRGAPAPPCAPWGRSARTGSARSCSGARSRRPSRRAPSTAPTRRLPAGRWDPLDELVRGASPRALAAPLALHADPGVGLALQAPPRRVPAPRSQYGASCGRWGGATRGPTATRTRAAACCRASPAGRSQRAQPAGRGCSRSSRGARHRVSRRRGALPLHGARGHGALRATGHAGDQMLLGETAPIGRVTGPLAPRPIPPAVHPRAALHRRPRRALRARRPRVGLRRSPAAAGHRLRPPSLHPRRLAAAADAGRRRRRSRSPRSAGSSGCSTRRRSGRCPRRCRSTTRSTASRPTRRTRCSASARRARPSSSTSPTGSPSATRGSGPSRSTSSSTTGSSRASSPGCGSGTSGPSRATTPTGCRSGCTPARRDAAARLRAGAPARRGDVSRVELQNAPFGSSDFRTVATIRRRDRTAPSCARCPGARAGSGSVGRRALARGIDRGA